MQNIDELNTAASTGGGYLALAPDAVMGADQRYRFRSVTSGDIVSADTPLELSVLLELDANPLVSSILVRSDIAPGWCFGSNGRDLGSPTTPDVIIVGTSGGRRRMQGVGITYLEDAAGQARVRSAASRCSDLRIPFGIVTDVMRDWVRSGSLLWVSECAAKDVDPQMKLKVLRAVGEAGFERSLGAALGLASGGLIQDIPMAICALGQLIVDQDIRIDFDRGVLRLDEPLARRRIRSVPRSPQELVSAWRSSVMAGSVAA